MKPRVQTCFECDRDRERCIPTHVGKDGTIYYVCPKCYKLLEYDKYLYDYHQRGDDEC